MFPTILVLTGPGLRGYVGEILVIRPEIRQDVAEQIHVIMLNAYLDKFLFLSLTRTTTTGPGAPSIRTWRTERRL